jgi:alkyl hydroperoxide reductase subunit AhpC
LEVNKNMSRKMMLINPHKPGRHGEESITVIVQMPLNLAYVAALTPGDWEFDVIGRF